jgi:rubrerythrin
MKKILIIDDRGSMSVEISSASEESMIAELKRLAKDLDKSPTWLNCHNLSDISLPALIKHFGSFNKALVAAGLKVNRIGSRTKRAKGQQHTKKPSYRYRPNKNTGYQPVFTSRVCNVCDRSFRAEDNMRSCPTCTTTKRSLENRGGFVESSYGIGYLT